MQHLASPRRRTTRWQFLVLRLLLSVLGAAAYLLIPSLNHAQAQSRPTKLALRVEDPRVEPSALAQTLTRELGIAVEEGAALDGTHPSLRVTQLDSGKVLVTLRRADKPNMERSAQLPEVPAERVETVALLAENLLRAEADELLATLQREAAAANAAAAQASAAQASAAQASVTSESEAAPAVATEGARPQVCTPVTHAVGIDLLPGVGMGSTREGREAVRAFSFGLVGAYSRGVRGFALSTAVDIQRETMCGVQLSAGVNIVGKSMRGVQLASFNYVGKDVNGAMLGMLNVAAGEQHGVALSFANFVLGDATGLSGGMLNFSRGKSTGADVGILNISGAGVHGAQLGQLNISAGAVEGAQLGLTNVAARDLDGAQLGLVNVAGGEGQGVQVGLVNVAGPKHVSIGLVSAVRKGRTDVDLWGPSESGLMFAGVRHGGKYVHNLYYVGARVGEHGTRLAWAFGLGVRALETGRYRLDVDAMSQFFYRMHADSVSMMQGLRVPLTVMVNSWLGIAVAPSYQFYFTEDRGERNETSVGVTKLKSTGKMRIESFPGIAVGLRFELPSAMPRAKWSR